jgi:hypothetical protein
MLENGFVKLHRSLLKWEWYDDLNTFKLFIHLLLTVNYYDEKWKGITIKRGSRVTGYHELSLETGISFQSVRTAINHLISTNEITKQSNSKGTIITITNYDKYQDITYTLTNDQQTTNKQLTNDQQLIKKAKKAKNEKEIAPPVPADMPDGTAHEMTREERLEKIKRLRR